MDEDAIEYGGFEEFDPDVKHMCRLIDFRDGSTVVRSLGEDIIAFSFKGLTGVQFENKMKSRALVIALRGDAEITNGIGRNSHLLGEGQTLFVPANEMLTVWPMGIFKMLLIMLGEE